MIRRATLILLVGVLGALMVAPSARAAFGLSEFDVTFTGPGGEVITQAGSHPFAMTTSLKVNTEPTGKGGGVRLVEAVKDLEAAQIEGLAGSPAAVPACSTADFLTEYDVKGNPVPDCPDSSAVGTVKIEGIANEVVESEGIYSAVYNIEPPPGVAAKLGFWTGNVPVTIELGVSESPPYDIVGGLANVSQIIEVVGSVLTLWGVPADPAHDALRGRCLGTRGGSLGSCPAGVAEIPFLTLPRACRGPLATDWKTDSWPNPGVFVEGSLTNHDEAGNPQGMSGCAKLAFAPEISSQLTSDSTETGSGLDFSLDFADEGLANPQGVAGSDVKRAEVTLPEGVTINPSVGEGLGVCTPTQVARESSSSTPGQGCPDASKIGTLHVVSPLVDEAIDGQIYLAQQDDASTTRVGAENPFDSLIALYFVLKNPTLGVGVVEPVEVEPDPKTGRLVASLDDNAQLPFSHFEAHLRTGARAALVTPGACGSYTTEAKLYPWADPTTSLSTTSSFQITRGVHGGPCPPRGVPPFSPRFEAGSINNNAGSFSPFSMRLTREDGEQDMTRFSATLPPGELGSLAGVGRCPGSAIAVARSKTGRQEIASPSCPADSLIGHTLAGAGVGSALTYVKGQIYLGGPYRGDPLSVIAITPAVAGPFDAGTVVVQEALTLNPRTAEVEVDGANSEPIPHIIKGIVLKLRDLRVDVDRQDFTLNPTSCAESSTRSVLFGSYLDVLDPADDRSVDLSSRFQATSCLNLGFKPTLRLNLKGGTKRGGHPGLSATYLPREGDANIKGLVVRLPRSAFLDQAHIKTICTRVQFAAEACPKASRYGYIKAWTPLLDEPLEGPVYLRSSNHKLPDLVFDLHGLVDVEVDVRIDSAHGGIRANLEDAPDAPLSKVVLQMLGGDKGLIINSRDLCGHSSKAEVLATGHNGRQAKSRPVMKVHCGARPKTTRGGAR